MKAADKIEEARRLAHYWRGRAGFLEKIDVFPWERPRDVKVVAKPGPKRFMYVMIDCPECAPGRALVTCPQCGGLGRVRTEKRIR